MKILADKHLYKLEEMLPESVQLTRYNPDEGFLGNVTEFDALLIRTVTKINKETLSNPGNLKFIGSATAGFDHVDTEYLDEIGITFANSAGCNANAVAEYVVTSLYKWGEERGVKPEELAMGVVGCGNTGSALIKLLSKLNIQYATYDPPKEIREEDFQSVSLKELFHCDVLSFHTPFTQYGPYATRHLCSKSWLKNDFQLIINTARGGVVDEVALLTAIEDGNVKDAVLDVWEGEPVFSDELANKAFIATPHIAGYSREAKWRASEMVVNQLCSFFDLSYQQKKMDDRVDENSLSIKDGMSFAQFMWENNQVDLYDSELRKLIGLKKKEKAEKFSKLRSETETRFEYHSIIKAVESKVTLPKLFDIFKN